MKYAPILALAMVVGIGLVGTYLNDPTETENERETVVDAVEEEVIEEVDVVDSARAELERINAQLDEEETRLLEEKRITTEKRDAELAEIEARLEQIRETRTGFQ